MKNIFLTGNLGYIGSTLSQKLSKNHNCNLVGFDSNLYNGCGFETFNLPKTQIVEDIRNINKHHIENIDVIIHPSALSNDPVGELNADLTDDINYKSTIKLAKIAKEQRIKRFIFISSQSMYGVSNTDDELDEFKSNKNPITSYAQTKWQAEQELHKLQDDDFEIIILRPSTVFGMSPMFRSDIVFNNLLSSALSTNKIKILTDGMPWRPVISIEDLCNLIEVCVFENIKFFKSRVYNVGYKNGNFRVIDLANTVNFLIPDSKIEINKNYNNDARTYKVSFKRLHDELGQIYTPSTDIEQGGRIILDKVNKNLKTFIKDFNNNKYVRINEIKKLIQSNKINKNLYYN